MKFGYIPKRAPPFGRLINQCLQVDALQTYNADCMKDMLSWDEHNNAANTFHKKWISKFPSWRNTALQLEQIIII